MKLRWILFPCVLIGLWSLLSYTGFVSEFFMATPSDTVLALYRLLETGEILEDLAFTIGRIVGGLMIGSVAGMLAGCVIGISPKVWNYMEGTVDFFRSLPAFALFPFFILVFGPGDNSKVATTAWFVKPRRPKGAGCVEPGAACVACRVGGGDKHDKGL